MKYIDAEKLIERLEEMKRAEYENCGGVNSKTGALQEVQELIASLQQEAEKERIKEQKELNKIAIQYRDDVIAHIEEKRVLPSFKGQLLHDFKNEVNTMRQILGVVNWGNVQNALFEKFALVFATWGGYHFHPKDTETEDSLQQEQRNPNLENEIKAYTETLYHEIFGNGQGTLDEFDWEDITQVIDDTARYFYDLNKNDE